MARVPTLTRRCLLACIGIVTLLALPPRAQAQREYDVWYFGQRIGLDFRGGGAPTRMSNLPITTTEGSASICSRTTGQPYFYTNGITIWDRNNQAMPNGTGLIGHSSSAQAALIVPVPCDTNRYYVFTSDHQGYDAPYPPRGVHYSVVDMRLNGGLGDVVSSTKNTALQNPASERLCAVAHANGYDYWVITHSRGGRTFYAWRVTATGVATTPVISTTGADQGAIPGIGDWALGILKASPNGQKLAMSVQSHDQVELFDFNPSSGIVSNPILIARWDIGFGTFEVYGLTFSPDNTKLYHTSGGDLWQYDLSTYTAAAITASRTRIVPSGTRVPAGVCGGMQIGPDGKVYIAVHYTSSWVGVINSPNATGNACNYVERVYDMGTVVAINVFWDGLPNNIDARAATVNDSMSIKISPRGPVQMCAGGTATFIADSGFASYSWSNGATTRMITVSQPGTYTVSVTTPNGCAASAAVVLRVNPNPRPVITGPNQFCDGDSVVLTLTQPFTSYRWSTGATTRQIVVRAAGTYRISVTDTNGCTGDTSFTVRMNPNPQPQIVGDLEYCVNERTTLDAGAGYVRYVWSTGDTSRMISVRSAGRYWVLVTDANGCKGSDTVQTIVHPLPNARILAPRRRFCDGDSATLTAIDTGANAGGTYRWSTGETTRQIVVRRAGWVRLEVTTAFGCVANDSILIEVDPNPKPTITIAPDADLCEGERATLDAGSGYASYLWSTGETTQQIVVSSAGSYNVDVVDLNGCHGVADPVEIRVHPLPEVPIDGPLQLCPFKAATYTTIAENGARYVWSVSSGGRIVTGQETSQISVQWSGSARERVTLLVETRYGCRDSSAIDVTINNELKPVITPDRDPRLCQGDSVTLDGGGGYAQYRWSTGATTRRIVVHTAGSYTLWVADSFGCEGTSDPLVVIVNPNPNPLVTPLGDVDLCQGDSVVLDAGSYRSYLWSTGATTRRITVKTAGSYGVAVVDSNGCKGASPAVEVTVTPLPKPEIQGPRLVCRFSVVDYSVVETAGNSYLWRVTAGTIIGGQGRSTITVKWGAGGNGTVDVTETTPNGCQGRAATVAVIIGDVLQPTITANRPTTLCDGDSVILDAGSGYNSYSWSTGETTQKIVVRRPGHYTVRVEGSNGCVGSSAEIEVLFNPNPGPDIAGRRYRACEGSSVILDAPAGYASYRWSTGETTQTIAVAKSGIYHVAVTDANGCYGLSQGDTVEMLPLPVKPIISANGNLLTSTAAIAYQWSMDDVDIPGANERTYLANRYGSYRVLITDENGCKALSDAYIYSKDPPPVGKRIHIVRLDTVRAHVGERVFLTMRIDPPLTNENALAGYTIRLKLNPRSLYVHNVASIDEYVAGEHASMQRERDGTIILKRPNRAQTLVGSELFRLTVEGLSTGKVDNPVVIEAMEMHPVYLSGGNQLSSSLDTVIVGGDGLVLLTGCDITHGFGAGKRAVITSVTPNPVHTGMLVTWRAPQGSRARLSLIDVTGRQLRSLDLPEGTGNEQQLSMQVLEVPSGSYMLEIRDGLERMNVPVVIVR